MLIRQYSDEDLMSQLDYYNEVAWNDVPHTIREQIISRTILLPARPPTKQEQWDTLSDAKEHRAMNNEQTMNDFKLKYQHKRNEQNV